MPQIVAEKCGLAETVSETFKDSENQNKILQTFMNKTILDNKICQSEMNDLNFTKTTEIATLNAQLVAAIHSKDRCDSQFALFQILSEKLEKQFNETLSAKTQDLRETIKFKMSEIADLLAEQQRKNGELNDKDIKIKSLEERIKMLEGQNQW